MAQVFRVNVDFLSYRKGDLIGDPEVIASIVGTEHESHGHMVDLADDHPAVLPHLDEDHPTRLAFTKMVADGADGAAPSRRAKPPADPS
jgi:hypothetical protein